MARRRGGQRSSKRKGQFVWSAVKDTGTLITTTQQEDLISIPLDWAVNASQRATLMSIRGWIGFTGVSLAAVSTISCFIIKVDQDIPPTDSSINPATIQNYVDEDVLWTGQWRNPGQITGAVESPAGILLEINVKAMRKLRGDEEIRLLTINNVSNTVHKTVILRGLVKVQT